MKIALLTVDGVGMGIAYKLQEEGHEVYVGQVKEWSSVKVKTTEKEKEYRSRLSLYDGLFDNKWPIGRLMSFLVGQPQRQRSTDWFVLCDFNWLWPFADQLRTAGYRGLLPHHDDFDLEHDRRLARKFIEANYAEVETGHYKEFQKTGDAIEFLAEDDITLYCLKGYNADAETIVPDTDDVHLNHDIIIDALEQDKEGEYERDGFILEEKIPDAVEFTPEAYGFNGELRSVSVDVEHKRLGSRNGQMTGCAADCVIWQELDAPIYEKFLEPLSNRMLRPNEFTIWDISIFYSPSRKKFYAGEFCSNRPGYNGIFTEISTFETTTDWLNFVLGDEQPEYDPVGVSLRVFNTDKKAKLFIGDPADRNVWCFDVIADGAKLRTTGMDKNAYALTESADNIFSAIDELYELEGKVEFDPGYNLQKEDWFDIQWPQNVLHRLDILVQLDLLSGGEYNAQAERIEKSEETARTDSGNRNGTAEERRAAAAQA